MKPLQLALRPRRILVYLLIAAAGCSSQQTGRVTGPTALAETAHGAVALTATTQAAFPPRNEPFLFRTNLESKYRDDLRREATSSYVDIEGTVVWTQEYLRYRVSRCGHAEAVAKVLRQIDGSPAEPECNATATAAFPPRNEPLDFRVQLEQKYRDGLRRAPTMTFVDPEGDIVWTLEYFRYRLSSCSHASAESKVFAQIDVRSQIPPDCTVCAGPPAATGFLGWSTFDVPPGSVKLAWEPAAGVVGTHIVELGTTRGASNIAVVEVSGASRSHTFDRLMPGDYFGRVRAKNDCGVSPYSNEANPRVR
jgi:hypothetical protein